ncbi:MAG: AraC family transcriptional regulator [Alcanivoracaceae bacterium]|jgi:AraC-like DNA-binding protein|nr:AraC family transcriptional regulator [Alcanivoracaceae bacterium]
MVSASRPPLNPDIAGTDRSLSVAYVASVLPALVERYQLDKATLLKDAGLPADLFERVDGMLPLVDVMRLFLVLLNRCADSGMGFEAGRLVRARSYQVLGYVILASANIGEAIEKLIRFEKLSGNLGRTEALMENDVLRLVWHCPLAGEPGRYLVEAAITGWVTFARQLVNVPAAPLRVCFRHRQPAEVARYEEYFGCPVEFAAPFDGLEVSQALLSLPLRDADPGLSGLMEREASQLMADYDSGTNLIAAVRREIYRLLAEGEPTLEQVAARLCMAERTLQGRLRKQGQGFQEVLDGLRRTLAELYLQDQRLSLTDIALLLGFAEQSSFTRAFRRWFSQSPAQYRQHLS